MAIEKNRKLKIAQIAPLWYPIPPPKYGGVERIVSFLTEELVKRGHQVTLFASGDSKTKAKLLASKLRSLAQDKVSWSDVFWSLHNLSFAFKKANDFDVIHSHVGLHAIFFQGLCKTSVIHTFHDPIFSKTKRLSTGLRVLKRYKNETSPCFISKQARKICPIEFPNSYVIYNGIDLSSFKFNEKPQDYFLWAGRIESYKGIENVVKIAKTADIKLYLVGKMDKEREEYFKETIKPYLNEKIKYLGELSQPELAKLYNGATAFLYPIEWEEPFGLTMVEAMACGAPVIVFDRGSAQEIVKDKETGFVVPFLDKDDQKNLSGFVKAIKDIDKISRSQCRKHVEESFTIEKMVDNYEKIYYEISKKR